MTQPREAWIVLDEDGNPAYWDPDTKTAGVFNTERECQEDILNTLRNRIEEFFNGEREFEDVQVSYGYVPCVVHPDGTITTEDCEFEPKYIRELFGVKE